MIARKIDSRSYATNRTIIILDDVPLLSHKQIEALIMDAKRVHSFPYSGPLKQVDGILVLDFIKESGSWRECYLFEGADDFQEIRRRKWGL